MGKVLFFLKALVSLLFVVMNLPKRNTFSLGITIALLAAILFSTKAIIIKLSYRYDVDAVSLLLLRMAFAMPFYFVIVIKLSRANLERWRRVPTRYWLFLAVVSALGYYLSSFLDFSALKFVDAGLARVILFVYPTFVALMTFVFFKERLSRLQLSALVTTYLGLFFVFGRNVQNISLSQSFWMGTTLLLLCAFFFALFLVASQWLIPRFGSASFTSFSMILAAIYVIIHFLSTHDLSQIFHLHRHVYLYGLAIAFFATVIPSYMMNDAIRMIGATRVGILSSIGPVCTILLAYWLLDERMNFEQIVGSALVIAGVTLVGVEKRRQADIDSLQDPIKSNPPALER